MNQEDEPKPAATPDTLPEAKAEPRIPTKPTVKLAPAKPEPKPEAKTLDAKSEVKSAPAKAVIGNKVVFTLALAGLLAGLVAAYVFGLARHAQPPVFAPVSNPFPSAIYANGMVESDQPSGENINIFPEVSGLVTRVLVQEGQTVKAGTVLFTIDDSVQRPATEQLRLQAEAAWGLLRELQAEPRPENLVIAIAQTNLAGANLKLARDQYDKDQATYDLASQSISLTVLDTAKDTVDQAAAALAVADRQYDLIRAGAWSYDVTNQQKITAALQQSYLAAKALLQKYSVRATVSGVVLAVNATVGSYVSSLGEYDTYTELADPLMVMSAPQEYMEVRCYIDEILVSRLPPAWHIQAQMQLTGTEIKIPLEFVRVQPYISPKIELSNEKQEQVDLRVLPVIFRFEKKDAPVYPGQMVDVFIGQK